MLQQTARRLAFQVKRNASHMRAASTVNAFGSVLPEALGDTHDWEAAWSQGVTPWDAGIGSKALKALMEEGSLPSGTAFVPGAGSGYDAVTLAQAGYTTTSLDISPSAVAAAQTAGKQDPAWNALLDSGALTFQEGDFFAWAPAAPFDVIFDYTFLCALPPAWRPKWASVMKAFLAPSGRLVTQLFPLGEHEGGPPFALDEGEVGALMTGAGFKLVQVDAVPESQSHPSRAGREALAVWAHNPARYPCINPPTPEQLAGGSV